VVVGRGDAAIVTSGPSFEATLGDGEPAADAAGGPRPGRRAVGLGGQVHQARP
jgi:hypothetical protein